MNKTSTFPVIWLANRWNLLLIELMFKWAIVIGFNFSCLITLKLFSETSFVKPFIPDASTCWDPYSAWKSLTQLKSSKIKKDDRKYFIKISNKNEFPRFLRWIFLFPKCSSSVLLLSIKSRCFLLVIIFCWQELASTTDICHFFQNVLFIFPE